MTPYFRLIGLSLFMLCGCAPMMSVPPSTPMPTGQNKEIGMSLNGGAGFQDSPLHDLAHLPPRSSTALNLQFHRRHRLSHQAEAGAIGSIGSTIAVGGYYRGKGFSNDTFTVAPQVELGLVWVGLRLPMAVKLDDQFQMTTQPGLVVGPSSALTLPLGFSRSIRNGWRIDSEVGVLYYVTGSSSMLGPSAPPWGLMGQVGFAYHGSKI